MKERLIIEVWAEVDDPKAWKETMTPILREWMANKDKHRYGDQILTNHNARVSWTVKSMGANPRGNHE